MSTTVANKLTRKQCERIEVFAASDKDIRVTGWDEKLRGPIVTFTTDLGVSTYVVTRDGGLEQCH